MTEAQWETLRTFYETDLAGGVDSFTFPAQVGTGTVDARFVTPPDFTRVSADLQVSVDLEVLP